MILFYKIQSKSEFQTQTGAICKSKNESITKPCTQLHPPPPSSFQNWHTWYLEDADFYSDISFLNFQ